MLKSYLKVAWRSLRRNKTFSIINITGLAIGLGCFLLIALYVLDELSFDRYYDKAENIYRVNGDFRWGGQELHVAQTSDMMGSILKKDYPQVREYARLYRQSGDKALIRKENEYITETATAYVDSTFFNVFAFPALEGDARTALNDPHTVVITASVAARYFGSTNNAIGKSLQVQEGGKDVPYKVNAVIADIPGNTHFHFDLFFTMKSLDYPWGQIGNGNFHTYLALKPGTDPKTFEKEFSADFIKKYLISALKDFQIYSLADLEKSGNRVRFSLMPVTRIHLHSDRQGGEELSPPGSVQYVAIFAAVALFILLIACVNFMNLTTARSAGRAREVGIRKVLGTERKGLMMQFLSESTLMVLLSFLIGIAIAYLALPLFNSLSGKTMTLASLFSPVILPLLVALPFAVGLLAGSYPAFFLSSFKPIEVLKGRLKAGTKTVGLRSALVVFQFTTSIVLIIGTIVVFRQLHYIQTRDLGFNKDQVLIIDGADALGKNAAVFKKEVTQLPGVKGGTLSAFLPVSTSARNNYNISKDRVQSPTNSFNIATWGIDDAYLPTLGITLLKGRNFSPAFRTDSMAVIINEAAAGILGYADPIGKNIYISDGSGTTAHPIVGLVKNFNFETLHHNIGPLMFLLQNSTGLASFKVSTTNTASLIGEVRNKWTALASGLPFSYRFLDDSFNEMYQSEQQVGKMAIIFSVLAVLISCLGMFGLATFVAEQRTKEVGIRKVLGASIQGIIGLLSFDFLKLVAIAFLIAAPLAWWVMNKWLQDFVYRVSFSWWIFVAAGLTAFLIALLTVSSQAVRAAMANPVRSLKSE